MTKLKILKALATAAALCSNALSSNARAEEPLTLERVIFVASRKWHLLKQNALEENILLFRKYSFSVIDGKMQTEMKDIKDIMDYGCQRTRNYSDYVVFHFPAWIKLQSIDSKQWLPKMDLRIALDGLKHTFTAEGEFKNGSLFVDLNDQFREGLMRLLVSEEAIIEFGPKDERLTVLQKATTPNGKGDIVGFIDDVVPIISSALGGGSVQSMETEVMLRKCVQYKKDGRF